MSKNVKFRAYFSKTEGSVHYNIADVNSQDVEIAVELGVTEEGYLKNAVITLKPQNEEEKLNYLVQEIIDESNMVQDNNKTTISLRQVDNEQSVKLGLKVKQNIGKENTTKSTMNQNSIVNLTGTYIDENGKEVLINKDVNLNLGWTGKYELKNNVEIEKYIPLDVDGDKKVFVQFNLKTGLEQLENLIPVESTDIKFKVPSLNGIKPEKIEVIAKSTKGTNGLTEGKVQFNKDNWKEENEVININVENKEDENGRINIGSGEDEYLITCIYSTNAYEESQKGDVKFNIDLETKMKIYNNEEELKNSIKEDLIQKETVGKLLSLDGDNKTEKIGKGKMYANANSIIKPYETEYEAIWNINVGYKEKLEAIKLQDEKEQIVDSFGKIYDISQYTKYKSITVSKMSFLDVLGEEGKITIYNTNGDFIGAINKASTLDENGDFIIKYYERLPRLVIETTKPISEGNLVITSKKVIDGQLNFSKSQIEDLSKIVIQNSVSQKE